MKEGSRGGARSSGRHSDMPLGETRRRLTPTSRSSLTVPLDTKPNRVNSDTLRTRSSHDPQPGQRFKREWPDAICRLPLQYTGDLAAKPPPPVQSSGSITASWTGHGVGKPRCARQYWHPGSWLEVSALAFRSSTGHLLSNWAYR